MNNLSSCSFELCYIKKRALSSSLINKNSDGYHDFSQDALFFQSSTSSSKVLYCSITSFRWNYLFCALTQRLT